MLKRFLIVVVIFLIAVVVAADRVGAIVGAHVMATKIQKEENLPQRPSASIGGIPFLTQAFGGKYKDVTITADEVPVNGLDVTTIVAHLHGVHLSMSQALHGSVSQVPIDRVDGTALVSYIDANRFLQTTGASTRHPAVSLAAGSNGQAAVTDTLNLAGKTLTLHGTGSVTLRANVVVIAVSGLSGGPTKGTLANSKTLSVALKPFTIRLPLTGLPFRALIQTVSVTPLGISASLAATNVVLGRHNHHL